MVFAGYKQVIQNAFMRDVLKDSLLDDFIRDDIDKNTVASKYFDGARMDYMLHQVSYDEAQTFSVNLAHHI